MSREEKCCPQCGARVETAGARFCGQCGRALALTIYLALRLGQEALEHGSYDVPYLLLSVLGVLTFVVMGLTRLLGKAVISPSAAAELESEE